MKTKITLLLLLISSALFAQTQERGSFIPNQAKELHILPTTSTDPADTTMIDSLSFDYSLGTATMTIYYKYLDSGTVADTLLFESKIKGNLTDYQYVPVDCLFVTTVSTNWRIWNITDAAVGVTDIFRIRKINTSDTLMALYKGFTEAKSK